MSTTDIDVLLDKYKKGETSPEETAIVENWLKNPDSLETDWAKMAGDKQELWLKRQFLRIESSIEANENKVVRLAPRRKWRPAWAAAAAILFISLSVGLYALIRKTAVPDQLISLTAPVNGKKAINLADGSFVNVNAGSELKYPKAFDRRTREVYLSGEAYFDIHHDPDKPFIIHTGKVVTTVLGTAFNIKEDKISHAVIVTVTRGKVSVSNGSKLIGVLTPNQQISFNTVNSKAEQRTVDAMQVVAWQRIGLKFEDITFGQAAQQLETKFKVKISFASDKVKNCRFTGAALSGDQLDKILKTICDFNNATYKMQADGSILIDGPGCDQ
ncbi:FecR domain-containing protein [Mucilaginibacter sp.]|uniref:FecR family protein n=1 Tax=Mucilaginibacter sp. TaxID=1882438 RepID=UPI00285087D4|nr:FecR domain-containing protein [Mucilaginibacter sp.]MDR3695122.1 FecR domain-containing protein [Mucilaginibacter sp.]